MVIITLLGKHATNDLIKKQKITNKLCCNNMVQSYKTTTSGSQKRIGGCGTMDNKGLKVVN